MTNQPVESTPTQSALPFDAIDTHEALVSWSRAYCEGVVEETDLAVDLDLVDWDVSTRAKRRAAAVFHPRIPDTALGSSIDWSSRDVDGSNEGNRSDSGDDRPSSSDADGPPSCTVRLTWDAARAYDEDTWAETLRHELVHVEQFQRFGTTGHGSSFEDRAADLDTTVRCARFAEPKYVLTCPACESVVARRYRDCKLVRRHDSYRSTCCDAPLSLSRTGASG